MTRKDYERAGVILKNIEAINTISNVFETILSNKNIAKRKLLLIENADFIKEEITDGQRISGLDNLSDLPTDFLEGLLNYTAGSIETLEKELKEI